MLRQRFAFFCVIPVTPWTKDSHGMGAEVVVRRDAPVEFAFRSSEKQRVCVGLDNALEWIKSQESYVSLHPWPDCGYCFQGLVVDKMLQLFGSELTECIILEILEVLKTYPSEMTCHNTLGTKGSTRQGKKLACWHQPFKRPDPQPQHAGLLPVMMSFLLLLRLARGWQCSPRTSNCGAWAEGDSEEGPDA